MSDNVNNPKHYKSLGAKCVHCDADIECIDITRNMNFNLGNVVKYVWRAEHKGVILEDLKKAAFYIQDEINRVELLAERKAAGWVVYNARTGEIVK